jgi:RNA polymerase sigma-70 factor (ECF subfamily)
MAIYILDLPETQLEEQSKVNPFNSIHLANEATPESFSEIYTKYMNKIYRYIFFRVGDEKTAEDLTSQVFMKAWERIDQYRPGGAQFLTWLYTIAHNTIIDHYRTKKETVALDASTGLASDGMTPEEASESHLERELLQQAIEKLTAEQQNVVILKYINGMSTEEIASHLGKKTGTVRALQMRALQSLSRQMAERI